MNTRKNASPCLFEPFLNVNMMYDLMSEFSLTFFYTVIVLDKMAILLRSKTNDLHLNIN